MFTSNEALRVFLLPLLSSECKPLVVDHSEVWGKLRRVGDTQLVICENDKSIVKYVNCLHDGAWNQIPECPAASTANTIRGSYIILLVTSLFNAFVVCVVQFRPNCQVWGLGPLDLTH